MGLKKIVISKYAVIRGSLRKIKYWKYINRGSLRKIKYWKYIKFGKGVYLDGKLIIRGSNI